MAAPEPEQIYERTRREGRRRLSRPLLELAATALVGGFDVALGVVVYGLVAGAVEPRAGTGVAHLAGSIGFGIAFVFIVVGRSELFTENFLVPITGLSRNRGSWLKLGELWAVSLVLNLAGGALLAVLLTSHGVLRPGSSEPIVRLGEHLAGYSTATSFLSGIVAGALMTVLTWFVEGAAESPGVRIVMAWIVGYDQLFANLGIAVAANLVGGLTLVTFARSAQAFGAAKS